MSTLCANSIVRLVDERAEIAELLLENLNPSSEGPHRNAWIKEIEARFATWERGEIASVYAFEVSKRLLPAYVKDPKPGECSAQVSDAVCLSDSLSH